MKIPIHFCFGSFMYIVGKLFQQNMHTYIAKHILMQQNVHSYLNWGSHFDGYSQNISAAVPSGFLQVHVIFGNLQGILN